MLVVLIAVIGLAGCGSGAESSQDDAAPTAVSQVSGDIRPASTQPVRAPASPPAATPNPSPAVAATPVPSTSGPVQAPASPARPTPDFSHAPGTSSFDADADGWMTAAELRTATIATMPEFRFPPENQPTGEQLADYTLASIPPADPSHESYQIKMEYTIISSYHTCAWERVFLQAHAAGDAARQQEALDILLAGLSMQNLDPGGRAMFEGYYAKARLGDPSGVANDVNVNCTGIGLLTPVPGTP